jgi:ABC-type polysaccharide/polyol phosphate export permease
MSAVGWTALAGLCCALAFAAIVQRIRRQRRFSGRWQFVAMLALGVIAWQCATAVIVHGGR